MEAAVEAYCRQDLPIICREVLVSITNESVLVTPLKRDVKLGAVGSDEKIAGCEIVIE